MWPFNREPLGYVLRRSNGARRSTIRGDLIPPDIKVIVQDGVRYVDTGQRADDYAGNWRLFAEDHATFEYVSPTPDLAARLLADAADAERMRDRYACKGNDKYPRQFPGEAYARLDQKARNLREAAAIVTARG